MRIFRVRLLYIPTERLVNVQRWSWHILSMPYFITDVNEVGWWMNSIVLVLWSRFLMRCSMACGQVQRCVVVDVICVSELLHIWFEVYGCEDLRSVRDGEDVLISGPLDDYGRWTCDIEEGLDEICECNPCQTRSMSCGVAYSILSSFGRVRCLWISSWMRDSAWGRSYISLSFRRFLISSYEITRGVISLGNIIYESYPHQR